MSDDSRHRNVDLLVRHSYVITMDDAATVIEDGAIAVSEGRIVEVSTDADLAGRVTADRVLDARGGPTHPGLIEGHLHASYHTFRGALPDQLAEADSFNEFEGLFYNTVSDEEEYLSVALASIEMIRNGTTCFLEAGTVLAPAAAARAAELVGIRAILGDPFVWDRPANFSQGLTTDADQARRTTSHEPVTLRRAPATREEALGVLGGQLARNDTADALVTGHIAVLGLGTASEALMMEAKRRADAAGVVLNIHQSYSPADVAADYTTYGKAPLVHLAEIGFLDRNITLAHANHLTDEECEVLLESGASVAWAPAASMMWGHGGTIHGRHAELWRKGANICLGSDSANWSNSFDLFRQMSLAVLTAREAHGDREYLVAEDGLYLATRGGARAVGMDDRLGMIAPGRLADLVIHTLDRPELLPETDMIRNLVYSSGSKSVNTVVVGGKIVLEDGCFTALDERAILREFRKGSKELLSRMPYAVPRNQARHRPERSSRRE